MSPNLHKEPKPIFQFKSIYEQWPFEDLTLNVHFWKFSCSIENQACWEGESNHTQLQISQKLSTQWVIFRFSIADAMIGDLHICMDTRPHQALLLKSCLWVNIILGSRRFPSGAPHLNLRIFTTAYALRNSATPRHMKAGPLDLEDRSNGRFFQPCPSPAGSSKPPYLEWRCCFRAHHAHSWLGRWLGCLQSDSFRLSGRMFMFAGK
jgi:hypothetical protein